MTFLDSISSDSSSGIFLTLAAGAALKYAIGYWVQYNRRHQLRRVGTVSALYVYPVKSFRGLNVMEAECTRLGLKYKGLTDRHWTVADEAGMYLTQRQVPSMALIEPSIHGDIMHLNAPGMSTLKVPMNPEVTPTMVKKVTVKTDTVDSLDCGAEAAQWLCKYLNRAGLRLHFSAPSLEKRDSYYGKKLWEHPALPGDLTAFSDYCSYMVLSNASLRALNDRLANPVPILNFRANIIVDDCDPFAEDDWKEIRIGQARLRTLDACTRCILTTVDQIKGVKDKNEEPLKTLRTFRRKEPYGVKPAFGVNATFVTPGVVRVGDPIYAF
ncbi:mitochondrial amidoxime-reducing component 1-like [Haliotis cracherodii]|uniref:mitochondrial amidoxime-reducing component 1-like n=1 Tax=Haliotis cracherodii TaxID=6455 RepID=UPI0039EBEF8C